MVVPPTSQAAPSGVAQLVSSTTNQSAFLPTPSDGTVFQLIAGRTINVGTVTVFTTNQGQLVVKYQTTGVWSIRETHLELALRPQDFPQTKAGATPGQFDYGGPQSAGTRAIQYVFDLGTGVPPGTTLHVGAHAVVTGNGNETAWSAGKRFGSNWFTYSTYQRPTRTRQLAVVKAFGSDLQLLGQEGDFTIQVTNNGSDTATSIVVSDLLDPLFTSADVRVENANGVCSVNDQSGQVSLSCTLNSLLPGESAVVRVEYMTKYVRGATGTLVNCATATDSDGNTAQGCASIPYSPGPV